MGCRKGNANAAYQMETCLGIWIGLPTPPLQMSLLPKVSTSHAHLLLEAIATNFRTRPSIRSSTAWVLLAWLDSQTSEDRPRLFLTLTLGTCDDNHGCRFPRLAF